MGKTKWSVLLSLVFVLGVAGQAMAAYTLDWFFVQHRLYEDGRDLNRIGFAIKNGKGQYVPTDQLKSITLTDPEGHLVPVTKGELKFYTYGERDGMYDGNNGLFLYGEMYPNSFYMGEVAGTLIQGTYHLSVKYATSLLQADYVFNGLVKLPVISASSIKSSVDKSGNLIAEWGVPMALCKTQPTLPTSVRVFIDVFQDTTQKAELYVRIPTHMGRVFVPKAVVDQLKKMGNRYLIAVHLRTNDNNNRTYSNWISIDLTSATQALAMDSQELVGVGER